MRRTLKRTVLLLACALLARAADDVVMRAMRDELARSMKKLQLENLEKPYFISYRALEGEYWSAVGSFGTLTGANQNRRRQHAVEVRVGDYALDNTNFISFPMGGSGVLPFLGSVSLPLDDNYDEIRRQIWLATDSAYKKALEDLSKKRAALENQNRTDTIADFSKEPVTTVEQTAGALQVNLPQVSELVRGLSRVFRDAPDVFNSTVRFNAGDILERYVNSEGSFYVKRSPSVSLVATASSQAGDGMELSDFVAVYGRSMADLPAAGELEARVRECARRIAALRAARAAAQYNGPVLFEGEAAAGILAQAFLHNVLGRPHEVADNPQMQRALGGEGSPFTTRIGARVMPESFTLSDDPTLATFQGRPLLAAYRVDQEAVAARRTVVVDHGILKTLLTSRGPVRRVPRSSGNRRGAAVMPSNVFLTTDKGVSAAELKAELLRLAKERGLEYGVVVRRLAMPAFDRGGQGMSFGPGSGGGRTEHAILAYKVYPDGREELMRDAVISELTAASFKDIIAGGREPGVYTFPMLIRSLNPYEYGGLSAGPPVVSLVVPPLLFEDVSVNKPLGEIPKPPASKHPFFDR